MNLRISNGFDQLADPNLLTRAQDIHTKMSGNPAYTTPSPTLVELQQKINAYSDALNACSDGDRLKIQVKDAKKAELIDVLHALGKYVVFTGQSAVAVASSGFTLAKKPKASEDMLTPNAPRTYSGEQSGEMGAETDKVQSARAYLFQYTQDPLTENSVWLPQLTTTPKTVLRNLTPGKRYWCRVTAVGPREQVLTSEASLSKHVQ